MTRHVRVAIIGTGFAGLGMAAQLVRHGIDDFVVIERADDVGGTWRDNTYPGAACDIRSDLYSFSFAPNPGWNFRYGRQPEILAYLGGVADRFGIRPKTLFGTELERAEWVEAEGFWRIRTSRETLTADVLVSGHGPLIDPKWADIPGLDSFTGIKFHSARWDHSVDLAGKTVAVIGTGASAIQFVPELQRLAEHVTVFQRTAPWIVPRGDRPATERRKKWFARIPLLQRLSRTWIFGLAEARFAAFRIAPIGAYTERMSLSYLAAKVTDPVLREKLTPHFRIGCKRILISSSFYPAMTKPNMELVTDSITKIEGDEIVTADGTRRRFDVLIGGTGFNATRPPVAKLVFGRDGVSLADRWSGRMSALRGTTVQDFPNAFLLVGPNTALGHNSIVYIIEAQIDYVLQALGVMKRRGIRSIEPKAEAQLAYNRRIQSDLSDSVWVRGGCSSYYLDDSGVNTTLWPHLASRFRGAVRRFDLGEYMVSKSTPTPPKEKEKVDA